MAAGEGGGELSGTANDTARLDRGSKISVLMELAVPKARPGREPVALVGRLLVLFLFFSIKKNSGWLNQPKSFSYLNQTCNGIKVIK